MLEAKLLEEIKRYKVLNKRANTLYVNEQELPVPAPSLGAETPITPDTSAMPPVDANALPSPLPDTDTSNTEEVDVTDLVNMTKNIKSDIETNKGEHSNVIQKMDDVFTKLSDLETKLAQMDAVIGKIDALGSKIEQMKPPTPVEKLEMRSLDSYPFNEKPQEFFAQKQIQMRNSGKNEYVLTKDDVETYAQDQIKNSFNTDYDQESRF